MRLFWNDHGKFWLGAALVLLALSYVVPVRAAQCVEYAGPTVTAGPFKGASLYWPINLPVAECVDIAGACIGSAGTYVGSDGICHRQIFLDALDAAAMTTITGASLLVGSALSIPNSADVAQAWMLGFGLPMICFLAAWGFGVVISMFKRDH